MTSPSPWSIKGIKPEAREAAKEAARKSGMTLGAWMTQQIIAQAAAAEAAAEQAVQDVQTASAEKAGQTRTGRAKTKKKTSQKVAPPAPSNPAEIGESEPEAQEKARRAAVKNALRGAAKAQRTRKRQAPLSAQSIEAPIDPAAQPSPQVSEALASFSARLDDVEARTKTDETAAKAAQERAGSVESAVQTLSSSVSDLRDEISESREKTAQELRSEVGDMVDVRVEAKTQAAIQRVEEIDASFDEIARTVDAATRRTASTDTSLRRLQETSQDQQALLEAMRAESAETKETLERLAARNSAPAEEVVEQVFNDPRLPTMIRGVVREAIEEIVLDDEFALLAEDAPAEDDDTVAAGAAATAARDADAERPTPEEPVAEVRASAPEPTEDDAVFLAWSGAPTSHPEGPWFTEPAGSPAAMQENDDEHADDAQAQSWSEAPQEQERDPLWREPARSEQKTDLATNAFAQAPEDDASDVLDLGQWRAPAPETTPRSQGFDAPIDDQGETAARGEDDWFRSSSQDDAQRFGQAPGRGEISAAQDDRGAGGYAPEPFDQPWGQARHEPRRPAGRRAGAESGLGAELGALVDQALEDERFAPSEEHFDDAAHAAHGTRSGYAPQARVQARQMDLQAARAAWRGELDDAQAAHSEQDWPEHDDFGVEADHGRDGAYDRRPYSETEQDLIDEAEAFLEAQERHEEPRTRRADALGDRFDVVDESAHETLDSADAPDLLDEDPRRHAKPSHSAAEAMRRAEQSIARLADEDFDDGDFPGLGRRDDHDREPFEPFSSGPEAHSTPTTPQSAVGAWRARRAEAAAADPVAAAEPIASSRRGAASADVSADLFDDGLYEASENASARVGVFVTLGLVVLTAAGAVVYLFLLGA